CLQRLRYVKSAVFQHRIIIPFFSCRRCSHSLYLSFIYGCVVLLKLSDFSPPELFFTFTFCLASLCLLNLNLLFLSISFNLCLPPIPCVRCKVFSCLYIFFFHVVGEAVGFVALTDHKTGFLD
ncbi:Deoxynucleoside triphosphate triphosphohydrolase SAMHD1, partial [Frankliniella fusca]